jgi:mRNA-degrading endonuclease toxin of MazEF toxin-antitoxin module
VLVNLFTIDQSAMIRTIGQLSPVLMKKVVKSLRVSIGLS